MSIDVLRGLIDRLLLMAAVVAGGLVPGFIAQYRQRLGGRLDQARLDLEPWRTVADKLYQGNLDQLIQFHLDSADPTVHSEGAVIGALAASVRHLQDAVDAMQGGLLRQIGYLALHLDTALARATYADWVPSFALSSEGLAFAVLFAVAVWLLFRLSWWLIAQGCRRWLGRTQPAR